MRRFNEFLSLTPRRFREGVSAFEGFIGGRFRQYDRPDGSNGLLVAGVPTDVTDPHKPAHWDLPSWRNFVAEVVRSVGRHARSPDDVAQGIVQVWGWAGLWSGGVRAYCPTREEFHALSQVEVRVPWSQYRQPFDTFVVVVPDGVYGAPVSADIGVPVCCVSRVCQVRRVASFVMPSVWDGRMRADLFGSHWWQSGDDRPIDAYIADLPDSTDMTGTESAAVDVIKRVAINANLLLANAGARCVGPANPGHAARLRESLAKKRLPDAARRANEVELKAIPVIYGLDQRVRVYERECSGSDGVGGWRVRPHWRRGHWANVACGAARAERRLVFRPAVLVHAEQFAGSPADSRVVYTTAANN